MTSSFRFLDLPAELRMQVYKHYIHLPSTREIRHCLTCGALARPPTAYSFTPLTKPTPPKKLRFLTMKKMVTPPLLPNFAFANKRIHAELGTLVFERHLRFGTPGTKRACQWVCVKVLRKWRDRLEEGQAMNNALGFWQDQALTVSLFVDCIRKVYVDVKVIYRGLHWQRDLQETTFVVERVGDRVVVRAPTRLVDWQEKRIGKDLMAIRQIVRKGPAVLNTVQALVMLQCQLPVFTLEEDLTAEDSQREKRSVVIADVQLQEG